MKKCLVLALALLVSSAAHAAMTVDVVIEMDNRTIEKTCTFDEQMQIWTFEQDGCRYVLFASEQADETVYLALNIVRINEQGEEVLVANPELVGIFGQELLLHIGSSSAESSDIVIKAIARKPAAQ